MTFPVDYPDPQGRSLEELDTLTLLACLVAGEARGEPYAGKLAVAWVVRNRVAYPHPKRFGGAWREVMLRPRQFSCFNAEDPNLEKLTRPFQIFGAHVWGECYKAAAAVYFGLVADPTSSADHYLASSLRHVPEWAAERSPVAEIGNHRFFRLVV